MKVIKFFEINNLEMFQICYFITVIINTESIAKFFNCKSLIPRKKKCVLGQVEALGRFNSEEESFPGMLFMYSSLQ